MTENEQLEMIGIINRIKAEAYKEFAERLKEKLIERSIVYVTIDDLLKEMVVKRNEISFNKHTTEMV